VPPIEVEKERGLWRISAQKCPSSLTRDTPSNLVSGDRADHPAADGPAPRFPSESSFVRRMSPLQCRAGSDGNAAAAHKER